MKPAFYLPTLRGTGKVYPFPPPQGPPLPPLPGLTADRPQYPPDPYYFCYAKQNYRTALPFTPPAGRDIRFERGNFCPVVAENLRVYSHNSRILSWDIIWYTDAELDQFFAQYAGAEGGTHIVLSMQQTLNWNKSYEDLERACRGAKRNGVWVTLVVFGAKWMRGSDSEPSGDYFNNWAACLPWLYSLHSQGLVDKVCACWQEDFWWDPMSSYEEMWFPLIAWAAKNNVETIRHNGSDGCWWANAMDDYRNPNTTSKVYGVYDVDTYRTLLQPITGDIARTAASRLGEWALAIEGRRMPDTMYVQIGPTADVEEAQSTCAKIMRNNAARCVLAEQIADDLFAEGVPPEMDEYGKLRGRIILASVSPDGRTFQGGLNLASTDFDGRIL